MRRAWRVSGIEPALRLLLWALRHSLEELAGRLRDRLRGSDGREARRERAAERLAALLADLRGAFTKVGQFASLRVDALPAGARARFDALQDHVPPWPVGEIVSRIESELGAPIGERFRAFEPEPLGTASIAQVHRARLPDGRPVAVKVQFPWLAASLPADLVLMRVGFRILDRRGGASRRHRRRLFQEFAKGLRGELDFEREGRSAEEIARHLQGMPQVIVPEIHWSHTTRRVLTMGFLPGVRIDDRPALARLGVEPAAVLAIVAHAYAKQLFVDGCFHADPHPGNLFVVDEPGADRHPRVLFLDFGLSRRLGDRLRREIRGGVLALLQGDADAFLAAMQRMEMVEPGAEERARAAVEHMFGRLRGEGNALALSGERILALKDEARELLARSEGIQLPDDLLLYAKTLSYLFALGHRLDPSVDLMRVSVPYLVRFLGERGA